MNTPTSLPCYEQTGVPCVHQEAANLFCICVACSCDKFYHKSIGQSNTNYIYFKELFEDAAQSLHCRRLPWIASADCSHNLWLTMILPLTKCYQTNVATTQSLTMLKLLSFLKWIVYSRCLFGGSVVQNILCRVPVWHKIYLYDKMERYDTSHTCHTWLVLQVVLTQSFSSLAAIRTTFPKTFPLTFVTCINLNFRF